ncbi:transglycosylase SLT domain-containing protein [Xenorhabdus stockiae]|uniref:transglycosylase SLT domain-containing protein n=1 Tax=Xenorhabdus stockiae TaxID=351614 RepID=UPI003CEC5D95
MSNTNADVIKEFLVSLGFKVDKAGEKKFSAVIAGVTANVLKFGAVVEGAAASVVGFTAVVATNLDKLYWQAQRTGGSAEQIKAFGYAVTQAGGTVEGLNSSLENVARFLRNNPGGEGFLRNMGIQTRDTNGQLRDTASLVALVGERLSGMPNYRANQYANMLGIDENTMLAMRRGMGGYAADYRQMMQKIGFNPTVAAKHANDFMTQFYRLKSVIGMGKDKVGGELARVLTPSIEKLTKLILDKWPTIEKVIMSVTKAIMTMSEVLGQMVYRGVQGIQDIISWWQRLDEGSKDLIKVFGAIAVAWWALNQKFLFSPIGIITALLAALFLLYDDYKTWQEGGKSLIDWSKWEGTLKQLEEGIKQIKDWLLEIKDSVGGWETIFWGFAIFFAGKWLTSILGTLGKVTKAVSSSGLTKLLRRAGLLAYGAYVVSDWDNIKASAESSLNSATKDIKRTVGNVGQVLGVENKWANQHKGYRFTDTTIDIPTGDPYLDQLRLKVQSKELTLDEANKILDEQFASGKGKDDKKASLKGKPLLESMSGYFSMLEKKYGHKPGLLHGIAMTESSGNPNAIGKVTRSGKQAQGMFQFMPDTAKEQGLIGNDVFDPYKSAEAAARYLSQLFKQTGSVDGMLAAYNWGIGKVLKYGISNLPEETRNYLPRVKGHMARAPKPGNKGIDFDLSMFENAMPNIQNMLSHSSYTPEYLRAASSLAQNQTTIAPVYNINVSGTSSPLETAALTGETVQRTNAILVRNLQTKVS